MHVRQFCTCCWLPSGAACCTERVCLMPTNTAVTVLMLLFIQSALIHPMPALPPCPTRAYNEQCLPVAVSHCSHPHLHLSCFKHSVTSTASISCCQLAHPHPGRGSLLLASLLCNGWQGGCCTGCQRACIALAPLPVLPLPANAAGAALLLLLLCLCLWTWIAIYVSQNDTCFRFNAR